MEQYTINEKQETEEGNISLEDQLAQQEAAKESEGQPPSGQEEQQPSSAEEELILGKFKSQEDLAEAYENLEKKLSEKQPEAEPETEAKDEGDTNSDSNISNAIEDASIAFAEKGELTDKHYQDLEKLGLSRDLVDSYAKGQQALANNEQAEITNSVGGQENYDAMAEWASNNLPDNEIDAFDKIVTESSAEAATMAVKGLYARYMSEAGGLPTNIRQGQTSGASVQPFQSNAQVVEAMRDKRYENDPAYREDVERRLAVSTRV
tara:strand:- start:3668 stop:4459 length:792 start_codon:yes stop_codon:yes gene_type:complete